MRCIILHWHKNKDEVKKKKSGIFRRLWQLPVYIRYFTLHQGRTESKIVSMFLCWRKGLPIIEQYLSKELYYFFQSEHKESPVEKTNESFVERPWANKVDMIMI